MKPNGQMLFRYDNAPHYPEITSHPHHKHISENVIPSKAPSLEDILEEINVVIIMEPDI